MVFDKDTVKHLLGCLYEANAKRVRMHQQQKMHERMEKMFGEPASFTFDEPPTKIHKIVGGEKQVEGWDTKRTMSGAIMIKEKHDAWGKVNESFDNVSEGTVMVDGVAYMANYDLPEPVDLNATKLQNKY